jgi:Alkylmercury lyase
VGGEDPFAAPGQPTSMSCRLFTDENGQLSGAPSVGQLRQVIRKCLAAAAPPEVPAWLDSLGRAERGRIAPEERGLRTVHQAVLRSFVHTGAAPDISSLAEHAAPFEAPQVLGEPAVGDFWCLDQVGQITAAYPFSALPTRYRVTMSGAATVFAMCAIDALGISAMTSLC